MSSVCFSDGDSGNSGNSSVPKVIPITGSCNDGVLNVHRTFPKISDKEQTWLSEYYRWLLDQTLAKIKTKALTKNPNVSAIYDHFNKCNLPLGHCRAEEILRYCKIEVLLFC